MTHAINRNGVGRGALVSWLVLFVVLMGIAVAKKTGLVDYDVAKRGVAVSLGLMLILAGNLVPKFRLFDAPGRDAAVILSAERAAGWTLVLAGLAYVVIWLLAPTGLALPMSSAVGFAAFASAAWLWIRFARLRSATVQDPTAPPRPALPEATLVKRALLAVILLTLLWTIAILFVDYLWGDKAAQWAAVWYPVGLGVLLAMTTPLRLILGRQP